MNWIHFLLEADAAVFRWINSGASNAIFDAILPYCREKWFWAPFYLFLLAFLGLNFKQKSLAIIVGILLAAGLADYTSSTLIKKNLRRLRPCNEVALAASIHVRVSCGSGYSFTSSHAANHFAVAVFLIGVLGPAARWIRPALLSWASLIAFSQVYVGVHYPGDVLCGALLGAAIGWWVLLTLRRWRLIPAIGAADGAKKEQVETP